jgi:ParB family chromosome partitioning protein
MDIKVDLIDVDLVDPPGDMDRDTIDPESIRELAESIREQGLLQPVLLRPREGGRFETVAGHRRLLAHKLIGETKIKALVKEMNDKEVMIVRATENLQKEDLTPIEKAKVYGKLRVKLNMSLDEIARKMGKHRLTVKKYLRLLDLPDYIQERVSKRELSVLTAIKLGEIEDDELRRYYVVNAADNGISFKVAEMWVQDYEASRAGVYYRQGQGDLFDEVKVEPSPIFVTCFCCHSASEIMETTNVQICKECYNDILMSRRVKK